MASLGRISVLVLAAIGVAIFANSVSQAGISPLNYFDKTSQYEENKVAVSEIRSNPAEYRGQNITVKGYIDVSIGLSDQTEYIVHQRFNRSNYIEFTDCKGTEKIGEEMYIIGKFKQVKKSGFYDGMNLTEEEKENIRTSNKVAEEYGYETPDLKNNETKNILDCHRAIPVL